jgi:2-iminoacetate synthase
MSFERLCQRAQKLTQQRSAGSFDCSLRFTFQTNASTSARTAVLARQSDSSVTLGVDEVLREAEALAARGFRSVLLVAGEHPKFVPVGYLADCVQAVRRVIPSVSLEVGPCDQPEYEILVEAGAEGLVVYQETYDREVYGRVHTAGPKRNFDWRLDTPERAYAAGFRRLGIGVLFGLGDWRKEATALAAHANIFSSIVGRPNSRSPCLDCGRVLGITILPALCRIAKWSS